MGIKNLLVIAIWAAFLGGASAFQSALPRPASSTALHAVSGDRRDALGAGFAVLTGAATFATPAFALRSVLSEEEEEMMERRKAAADAARSKNKEFFKGGIQAEQEKRVAEPPKANRKMKFQENAEKKAAEESGPDALEAARAKREEKKLAQEAKTKARKRNCNAMEEMKGKCK